MLEAVEDGADDGVVVVLEWEPVLLLLLTFRFWTGVVVDNDDDDGDDDMFWAVADGINILADVRNSNATTIVVITVGVIFIANNKVPIFLCIVDLGGPNIYIIFRFSTLRIRYKCNSKRKLITYIECSYNLRTFQV